MKILVIPGSGAGGDVWHYQALGVPGLQGISLPGHPQGAALTSVPACVEWLRGLVLERGHERPVIGGHSLGSAVALLYALTYPAEVNGLVLVGAGARLRVRPDILESVKGMIGEPARWRSYIDNLPMPSADPVVRQIRETRHEIGPAVLLNDFLCCDRFDVMARLHEIAVPTLIIVGSEDVMTPVKYAQYLTDRIRGSRLVVIQGATHSVTLEKPEEVNGVIRGWLAETFGVER